jgi:hypothetical protein
MWEYFEEKLIDRESRIVCSVCGWSTRPNQSTSMRAHLSNHTGQWQIVLEKEKKENVRSTHPPKAKQLKLSEVDRTPSTQTKV